jgi:enamine deaminase RidA (YjgF/YER057c/UK114 family)
MSHTEHFSQPAGLAPSVGYSHAVTGTGRLVAISGQIALDESGEVVAPNDPRAQAERVFENIKLALAAAGATFKDVIKLGVFVTDVSCMPVVREVRNRYIDTDHPPASTAVQVSAFVRPGLVLEVEAWALVSD